MKNALLFTLFFIVSTIAEAQIVDIPDANFKAALIEEGVDTNVDGEIQVSEAEAVTDLYVSWESISSLVGISYFVNLTGLSCDGNRLTELNVDNLINLTELSCGGNQLTELNVENLINLTYLSCGMNQLTELNVDNLTNLTELRCYTNDLTELNVDNLINLTRLYCYSNQLTELNVDNLINLTQLICYNNELTELNVDNLINLTQLSCYNNELTELNVDNLINLTQLICYNNELTELNVDNLINLTYLSCGGNQLTELNVDNLINLTYLSCRSNQLTELNVDNLINLTELRCYSNDLTELNVDNLINLTRLWCFSNRLSELNVDNLINLTELSCGGNQLTELNVNNLINLTELNCLRNQLTELNVDNLINLTSLSCFNNQLTELNVDNLINLTELWCYNNELAELNVDNLINLTYLSCSNNQLTELNVDNLINLTYLSCSANQLTELNVDNLINLTSLSCDDNQLTELNVDNLINLTDLRCYNNELTELNVDNLINLTSLSCFNNQLTELNVDNLINLTSLQCDDNQLTELNVDNLINLTDLRCYNNELTELNVDNLVNLEILTCSDNQLLSLNIKNGVTEDSLYFNNNPDLLYICSDTDQLMEVQSRADSYGLSQVQINSYCSFTPGGEFYTIQGNNIYDADNNGCDISDLPYPYLQYTITDGMTSGGLISNQSGEYSIPVQAGRHTIHPILEHPDYFDISLDSLIVDFPTDDTPYIQDWCITPNGVHDDLAITIVPVTRARPGFNASYKINYQNKGTTLLSGAVEFTFSGSLMEIVTTSPIADISSAGMLGWDYTDLAPFEERSIMVEMNLNSPMDDPPLNGDDELSFTASISPMAEDETPEDNVFTLNQDVVNSFDPNDKICLEGKTITPDMIGDYVHYQIRFENTGTADAIHIVVKDTIDTDRLDVSSLQIVDGSHPFVTRIKDNVVEFIFENINLPFADAENDGYLVFKIKSLSTLEENDIIANKAEIFFDFNFPIVTDTYETTIAKITANNNIDEIKSAIDIYPNPAHSTLFIGSDEVEIIRISMFDMTGRIIKQLDSDLESDVRLDISNLAAGIYMIKVYTDHGAVLEKIVVE